MHSIVYTQPSTFSQFHIEQLEGLHPSPDTVTYLRPLAHAMNVVNNWIPYAQGSPQA